MISRRSILAAGAGLLGSSLVPRIARAATPPKRLVIVFSANGTIYQNWAPTGTETNFTLSPILTPLSAHQSNLLVLDGIDVVVARNGPGDDHMRGMGCMLTGIELLPGTTQGGAGTPAGLAGGPSIDQRIAQDIGAQTRFPSLEYGVYVKSADVWSRMIYAASNQPNPPMEDPVKVYQRLFSNSQLTPDALARLLKRRQSVLDHAAGSLDTLSSRVGTDDKARIDAHAASVREIEKQLVSQAAACNPAVPPNTDLTQTANYPAVGKLQMDMLVAALACDQTRIASLQFSHSVSQMTFPWLGITDPHHDLSHLGDTDTTAIDKLTKINTWYATQFAYLLDKLASVQESNGTLLDNTLVIWVNELAKGNAHSHSPLPVVIAGKCQGAVRTGRYVKLPQLRKSNDLLTGIANAMGTNITQFGNPAYCTSPLALT
jgi:hypothetical protein